METDELCDFVDAEERHRVSAAFDDGEAMSRELEEADELRLDAIMA